MSQVASDFQVKYDPSDPRYYLYTHDLYTASESQCTLKENRFKTVYTDPEGKKQELYCWKGRIQVHPDCVIGSVCDPYSYTNARSSFCRTWGCTPDTYVSNAGTVDANLPVMNARGGIVVYNERGKCGGGFANQINCFVSGFKQSIANVMDPKNRNKFLMGIVAVTALALIGALAYRKFHKGKGKKMRIRL